MLYLHCDLSGSRDPVPNSLCLPQSLPAPGVSPVVLGTKHGQNGDCSAHKTSPSLPLTLMLKSCRWFRWGGMEESCGGQQGQSTASREACNEGRPQAWGVRGQGSPLSLAC